MKKVGAGILALFMACSLLGCKAKSNQTSAKEYASPIPAAAETASSASPSAEVSGDVPASAGIPNPMHESSAKEILNTLGISLHIPDKAEDVSYFIIDNGSGAKMAQAVFKLENMRYTYRVQSTSAFADISGAYFEWTETQPIEVSYCSGEVRYILGEQGICLWYDIVPGLMYSLYTETSASVYGLQALANELFVPAKDAP